MAAHSSKVYATQHRRAAASNAGFTLIEITIAVAIFVVAIGITALSLSRFYVTMDMQEQRIEAIHASRSVISVLREKRADFAEPRAPADDDWPALWVAWIEAQNGAGWEAYLRDGDDGSATLPNHEIEVLVSAADGGPVTANTDLVEVHVISRWTGRLNWTDQPAGQLESRIATLMSDR